MISKSDLLLLLTEMQNKGIDTQEQITKLYSKSDIDLDIIRFINENRQLDLLSFYENLRKNYNKKKSNLYINIMKEINDPNEVTTTLASMLTQLLLFNKKVDNKQMFLRHARAGEISKVLNLYFTNYDLTNCIKLIKLIKADIKVLQEIKG